MIVWSCGRVIQRLLKFQKAEHSVYKNKALDAIFI
jgi:hypothetical protein